MQKVFMISDQHWGHRNIIDYESRPFDSLDEMNAFMIKQWNSVVGKGDKVFHLGDVSLSNKAFTSNIIEQLNGYKFLIMGNHDRQRSRKWWSEVGFNEVVEYPIIYKDFYILSHEPIYLNKNMPMVNLHGHTHGQKYEGIQHVNMCVEHWNYTPVNFDQITEKYATKEETEIG